MHATLGHLGYLISAVVSISVLDAEVRFSNSQYDFSSTACNASRLVASCGKKSTFRFRLQNTLFVTSYSNEIL